MRPASVVYGADAFMGVINRVTFDAQDETMAEVSAGISAKLLEVAKLIKEEPQK